MKSGFDGKVHPDCWTMTPGAYAPAEQQYATLCWTRPDKKPSMYASPAPLVSTSFSLGRAMIGICCDLSADADNGWVCFLRDHYHARLAPVLREDGRFLRDGRHIILHPSFSFSERRCLGLVADKTPTSGIVFIRTALNGGTCMMKGALRFMQYVFPCLLLTSLPSDEHGSLLEAGTRWYKSEYVGVANVRVRKQRTCTRTSLDMRKPLRPTSDIAMVPLTRPWTLSHLS